MAIDIQTLLDVKLDVVAEGRVSAPPLGADEAAEIAKVGLDCGSERISWCIGRLLLEIERLKGLLPGE